MGFSSEQLMMGLQALKPINRHARRLWEYTPNLRKAILPLDLFDRKPFEVHSAVGSASPGSSSVTEIGRIKDLQDFRGLDNNLFRRFESDIGGGLKGFTCHIHLTQTALRHLYATKPRGGN
jgi:hypothetical protein